MATLAWPPKSEDPQAASRLRRLALFGAGIVVFFGVLVVRLANVQLVHGDYFERLADLNQIRTVPIPAPRGLMYDRSGVVLVRNRPSFVVQVVPMQLGDPHRELADLSRIVGVGETELWRRLLHQNGVAYKDFLALANAVPLGPVVIAEDLRPETVARFAERADRFEGMTVELVPVRNYNRGTTASHAVGYVGQITQKEYQERRRLGYGLNDVVGKEGLEFTYDSFLRGRDGGRRIKVNSAGRAVAMLGDFAAEPGNNLDLTIDWRVQRAAEDALAEQIRVISARVGERIAGAALVADPNTGEILALASQPNIDPNDFAAGISGKKYAAYLTDRLHPLFNRAIAGAYPTGSTFKLVTASAALASGVLTPQSTRYCGGAFFLGSFGFNDDRAGGHGTLDIPQAIGQSCDVFFYQVGFQLGIKRLDSFAALYGLGRKSGIDIPGETEGLLPTPDWKKRVVKDDWYAGDTVNLAIGQGYLEASPVQMLKVVSAIANGGRLLRPHLVAAVRDPHGRVIARFAPHEEGRVPLSAEDLAIIREGMRQAIESPYGTAHNVLLPGLHYAGKTGTAENVPTIDNPSGRNHAWFLCYAPFDHPQIAVAVFMEQSSGFGAVNAAPVARAIVASYFHLKTGGPAGAGIRD